MKNELSIISTLIEAARLAQRHAMLVVVLTVLAFLPGLVTVCASHEMVPFKPSHSLASNPAEVQHGASKAMTTAVKALSILLLTIPLQLAVTATLTTVILGVVSMPHPAGADATTVRTSIRKYFWPLTILSILLALIAVAITIPFYLVIDVVTLGLPHGHSSGPHLNYVLEAATVLRAILYLIFVKYALAGPLVVIENMDPSPALMRSWQMTRSFFWYVFGCYVFVGTAEYFIGAIFRNYMAIDRITVPQLCDLLFKSIMQCYWIFLSWCMFRRIRETDNAATLTTQ